MPTLQENLNTLVNFLANVDPEKLGPSGSAPTRSRRAQPQSEEATNHSRALLLLTDLFVKQPDGKLALNENINEAFQKIAATTIGRQKLEDALSKMELVFKNYNGILYKAFGLEKEQIAQFREAASEFKRNEPEHVKKQKNILDTAKTYIQNVTQSQLDYLQSDLLALQKNYSEVVEQRSSGFTGKARQVASHFFKRANPDRHGHDIERMINQVKIALDQSAPQQNLNQTFYATIAKLEDTFLKALKVDIHDPKQVEKRLREMQKDKNEHMFLKLTAQTLNSVYAKYDIMLTQTPERQEIRKTLNQVMDIQSKMAFKT